MPGDDDVAAVRVPSFDEDAEASEFVKEILDRAASPVDLPIAVWWCRAVLLRWGNGSPLASTKKFQPMLLEVEDKGG